MLPQVAVNSLGSVQQKYNKGIELTTKGEFVLALDTFRVAIQ